MKYGTSLGEFIENIPNINSLMKGKEILVNGELKSIYYPIRDNDIISFVPRNVWQEDPVSMILNFYSRTVIQKRADPINKSLEEVFHTIFTNVRGLSERARNLN